MFKFWILFYFICTNLDLSLSHDEDLVAHWDKYQLTSSLSNFRTSHFDPNRNKLYMGGVNTLYEFDSNNITSAPKTLTWQPEARILRTCLTFKTDAMLCQNNLGVLEAVNDTHLYVCGTMAYAPVCRYVRQDNFSFEAKIDRGRWKTPYNPYVSTVSVVANQTLFTATQDNMQGNKGIISRTLNGVTLRTLEDDRYWLSDPIFVGGYHVTYEDSSNDKVMIFFRERADEFRPYDFGLAASPHTRNVVSRVATVCVNDHGGSAWVLNRKFATYQKMTIVCSTGHENSESTFQYTLLESTFVLKNDADPHNPTIFGIFSMPSGGIGGSAVCAYKMQDVLNAMSQDSYWKRHEGQSEIKTGYVGNGVHQPGECVTETRDLTQSRLTFSKKHPVKFGTVFPSAHTPFYQESPTKYAHIVVHKLSADKNSLNQDVTVMYLITMEGRLKRVVSPNSNPQASWSLPDIQAVELESDEHVIKMEIGERNILVITNRSITQVPLAACSLYEDCKACESARDPYCILSYDQICASVFALDPAQINLLRNTTNICANVAAPPTAVSRANGVDDLEANLTYLIQRNAEALRKVATLTMDRNRKAEAHGACNQNLESWRSKVLKLTNQLVEVNQTMSSKQRNLTETQSTLKQCTHSRNIMSDHMFQLSQQLRNQRNEFEKVLQNSRHTRNLALGAVRDCETAKVNATRIADSCTRTLEVAKASLIEINNTCMGEKQFAIDSLRAQINVFARKFAYMKLALGQIGVRRNYTIYEMSKRIGMCRQRNKRLQTGYFQLQKKTNSISLQLGVYTRLVKRQGKLIKRLKWLHKQNGQRGQQNCQYDGWFQVNSSGSLFLLGKRRVSFSDAKGFCEALGGRLAIFRNQEELRYINNVIRAHQPRRNFWIGLVKNANRALTWHNGSPLGRFRSRFPESQRARLVRREKYCVEINAYQRWILIPCFRIRRPICQKDPVRATTRSPYSNTTPSYRVTPLK